MAYMRFLLVMSLCLACSGCLQSPIYSGKGRESYIHSQLRSKEVPRHTLDLFVDGLAREIVKTNSALTTETPLALVSFVDLEHYDETNWLGNTLTESMIFQLQRRGFIVVDFKNTGAIRVTKEGDFALTRDWMLLSPAQEINYLLVGTMLRQAGGVIVNTRIVNVNSRVVVASGQGFLPNKYMGRKVDTSKKVRLEDGAFVRGEREFPMKTN